MRSDNDDGTYFTKSSIGDAILGVLIGHLALVIFWIVTGMLLSPFVPYLWPDRWSIASTVTGFLWIAPPITWRLAIWLGQFIKKSYQTCGRAFQFTVLVYGIAFFGWLAVCTLMGLFIR